MHFCGAVPPDVRKNADDWKISSPGACPTRKAILRGWRSGSRRAPEEAALSLCLGAPGRSASTLRTARDQRARGHPGAAAPGAPLRTGTYQGCYSPGRMRWPAPWPGCAKTPRRAALSPACCARRSLRPEGFGGGAGGGDYRRGRGFAAELGSQRDEPPAAAGWKSATSAAWGDSRRLLPHGGAAPAAP